MKKNKNDNQVTALNEDLDTKFKDAGESPGFLFWKVANLHQRKQRQALKSLEISPTQFSVLACYFFLKRDHQLPAPSDICTMAGLDKMLVSDTTKALIKKKLVRKKTNPKDQRSFLVELTAEGKLICNKSVKLIEHLDQHFFALTGDPKLFHQMLKKIEQKAEDLIAER